MLLEFLYGIAVNSLGLISDSFHMMLDGTSIAIGLYAAHAASWRPDEKTHPFGYARYEVFGGFVNGILLLFIALYVTVESIQRIIDPPEIEGPYLLLVSVIGLVVNIIGIIFFHDSHGHSHSHSHGEGGGGHVDHNMRGVYLHILADLLGSVSVIISSVIIYFFGFWVADPICSALSAVLILMSAFPLLEETGKVLLLSAPEYGKDYSDELRVAILETGLLQDVVTPTIWVHSTPPRELVICTVAGKMRSGNEYASTRKKLIDTVSHHMMNHLDAHNVSVVIHLE
ncbi:putative cation transporter [Leptomonas pyrrhocoris]|uniref:Putative cation transporter n=1 Tax=Leptomonas pyrrhocoris TaxID=157538 RepID=A0A0N0VFK4_LEPPY|nr:putative cation transporter [Leptomonas pyrrhocoris]KPA80958.1 putative cation transporter [Leptomonas pyrrhocoris]|eukprot:XP_015659397.1 putative cation transporter [Leptomonas pyrrhocoris]